MTDPVGFIGTGHMGGAMAHRLIDQGVALIVYDVNAAVLGQFGERGATVAKNARDVAERAPVVFACLPSTEASLAIAHEVAEGGALEVYIEASTIGTPTIGAIADILAPTRIALLDAPVSGGPDGARQGTLAIMPAGPAAAVARARPALEAVAGRVFVVGDTPGQGQICKLVNNAIGMTNYVLSCEAIMVGVKAGMNAATLVDVINASTGRNSATEEKIPQSVLTRRFDYGAPMNSASKDFELYLDEARRQGLPSFVVRNALELWRLGVDQIGGDEDYTAFIKLFEGWAGVEAKGH